MLLFEAFPQTPRLHHSFSTFIHGISPVLVKMKVFPLASRRRYHAFLRLPSVDDPNCLAPTPSPSGESSTADHAQRACRIF
ncbi:hypothetical protein FH972_008103 [Carpinus fangiana]|uniref:Uncharacterized protein n=1 Tax=Carpinus fangiana TaxID=176857 RepID=A0A5N6QZZ1_9ROSI|nr:hypothetical protein FH972_008103 [Carpinus fangiana]